MSQRTFLATTGELYDHQAMIHRLERLEKENRRLKWAVAILSSVFLVVMGTGAQQGGVPKLVEARAFVLRGDDGQSRVVLGSNPFDGGPFLSIFDKQHVARLTLTDKYLEFLKVRDGGGRVVRFDETQIEFRDGGRRCSLGMTEGGVPYLRFRDRKGKLRLVVGLNPDLDDASDLRLMDSNESVRAGVGLEEKDSPRLYFRHPDGHVALNLGIWPDASAGFKILREGGIEQVYLQVQKDGAPSLRILNKDGSAALKVP
jgi:hypothetical protein